MENTPASWGSTNPEVLILGFSKGENQSRAGLDFNSIPFHGFRSNLTKILQRLKLLSSEDKIDSHIHASEQDFGFGSLLRCSVSKWDQPRNEWAKSGDIIENLTSDPRGACFLTNCADQFLKDLPSRLKLVVMLSNSDSYVQLCRRTITNLHRDVKHVNEVAYGNAGVTWVHVIHPSGSSGRHIPTWLAMLTDTRQGLKGALAYQAVERSGAVAELRRR
ncbi:MAG TPA: hypothetical protein VMV72_17295 [Verrucomicrobiae bacterium]|nr:hypothetical protein [Verrucomicrobiae bacterium]